MAFYRAYPFDDLHRFHRPAAAIAGSFGGKTREVLDWLAPAPPADEVPQQAVGKGFTKADIDTMNAMFKIGARRA